LAIGTEITGATVGSGVFTGSHGIRKKKIAQLMRTRSAMRRKRASSSDDADQDLGAGHDDHHRLLGRLLRHRFRQLHRASARDRLDADVGHQEEDQDREHVDQRHEVHVDHRLVAVAPLGALLQRG